MEGADQSTRPRKACSSLEWKHWLQRNWNIKQRFILMPEPDVHIDAGTRINFAPHSETPKVLWSIGCKAYGDPKITFALEREGSAPFRQNDNIGATISRTLYTRSKYPTQIGEFQTLSSVPWLDGNARILTLCTRPRYLSFTLNDIPNLFNSRLSKLGTL